MKIKSLNIKNFKSLVDITIEEPNNFSVFAGPNASGKSNIFEAIEIIDFIQNAAKHPGCKSAKYFINKLKILSKEKE